MVMSFFRGAEEDTGEHIESEIAKMLNDCRHSFDVAMSALITDADLAPLGEEVRETDRRINGIEESVRRELVVHGAVGQGADITMVLTSLLIVKKLERVGDQAKNIFVLADEGVRFSDAEDYDRFNDHRNQVSNIIADAVPLMGETEEPVIDAFVDRCETLMTELDDLINSLMHSDDPAHRAVPRAMLWRYLKRIVANVSSVVTIIHRPFDRSEVPELDE